MSAAPIPPDEAERLEGLRRYGVLDTEPELAFDRITSLAARLFDVPIALVSLVDEHRQWFKSCIGIDDTETRREISFCAHAILEDDVMVVPDATRDRRFEDNESVLGDPWVRFYAGAPLRTADGLKLGTLCVVDTDPRPEFTDDEQQLLADLAAIVMNELELRYAGAAMVEQARELAAATDAAERASAAKSRMVSLVSHEMRNALVTINGFAELLTNDHLGDPAREYAETIRSASTHLTTVVEDLLDLGRLEGGVLKVEPEPVDLAEVARRTLQLVRPLAGHREVEVTGDVPGGTMALADPDRMLQVLLNLVGNAVKYNREGGSVRVSGAVGGGQVRLTVSDTGRGLDPDELAAIFDPFVRAGSSAGEDGSGLGLAICRQLVEAMGGEIGVQSEPGVGSRFVVTLPGA